MARIASAPRWAAQHASCGFVLGALICLASGCTAFQNVVSCASHWQENRADCPPFPDACDNNDCVKPCVSLEPVDGYLKQAPTFGGEQILGESSPSAIERMTALQREVESLRIEKEDLRQQLNLAEETIRQQGVSIDAASQELQRALTDFNVMRNSLAKWEGDVHSLREKIQQRDGDREELLSQFEADLQAMLNSCETQVTSGHHDAKAKAEATDSTVEQDEDSAPIPAPAPEVDDEAVVQPSVPAEEAADDEEELPLPPLEERPVLQTPVFSDLEDMPTGPRQAEHPRSATLMWVSGDTHPAIEPLAPVVKHMDERAVNLTPPRNQEAKHDSSATP